MSGVESGSRLAERAEKAAMAARHNLEPYFKETAKEILVALARNPHLIERDLLRLLERKALPPEAIREISSHKQAAKSYTIKLALACHPKPPRLISLPILKFLYLFDLLRVVQTPAVPADVKIAAEENILKQAESIPRGEKITLARRASGRIVAGLLQTEDQGLIQAGLDNPFLTEAHIIKVLGLETLPRVVVAMISKHTRWSARYYVRLALIRHPSTPFEQALNFVPHIAITDLHDICLDRRMPAQVRSFIENYCAERHAAPRRIT